MRKFFIPLLAALWAVCAAVPLAAQDTGAGAAEIDYALRKELSAEHSVEELQLLVTPLTLEQLQTEADRPQVIRKELTEARKRLDELLLGINAAPPADELPQITQARRSPFKRSIKVPGPAGSCNVNSRGSACSRARMPPRSAGRPGYFWPQAGSARQSSSSRRRAVSSRPGWVRSPSI